MRFTDKFQQRLESLNQLAEGLQAHRLVLAEAAATDAGFSVKVTLTETDMAIRHLQTMAEEVPWVQYGRPYGTVGAIFPYDAPVVVLARLGGGAILTGNRLRFSFSSMTPRTARQLATLCAPFDPLEPTLGEDNRHFGRRCIEDSTVRVLFISGSSSVGEAYRQHHQAFDKLFFAGPGGMPAAVVFEDADPDQAGRFIARRAFINGGQYCTTLKKALVHERLFDAVRDRVLEAARRLQVGNPFDPATDIGPIRVERTLHALQKALDRMEDRSTLLTGGIDGEWVHPMVLVAEEIPDLELFGPFLALKPFRDPQSAVEELTRSRYGFLLTTFGTPPSGAIAQFHAHFGMVHDNPTSTTTNLRLPFGGKKASGWILERDGNRWIERDGGFLYSKELVWNEP